MPSKPRIFKDEGYYHVFSRGNNQRTVFLENQYYKMFKKCVLAAKAKYGFKLFHYCLMPNHFHMLLQVQKGRDLSKAMHHALLAFARWYKIEAGYSGYLWQGRFKSPLIDKEDYMLECGRYIERNPVRAGLVSIPESYPWSSYQHYALGTQDALVDKDPYYEGFGLSDEDRRVRYIEFVRLSGPYEVLLDKAIMENYV